MPFIHFYDEPITVSFDQEVVREKVPFCPSTFTWRGETFRVTEMLSAWVDNRRRGRVARNMQPQHAAVASNRGSWGVGRYYFRVRCTDGRIFELYYDRAPKDADARKGTWILVGESAEGG
jgi:hypothetical protein